MKTPPDPSHSGRRPRRAGRRRIQGLTVGQLCILHLENLDTPLTAAERAFLLDNDPAAIAESADLCAEQGQVWTENALETRSTAPEDAAVSLDEARAWTRDATATAEALAYATSRRLPPAAVSFDAELDEIRRHEREWLAIHTSCEARWDETEDCPIHGAQITAGRARQHEATLALRDALHQAMRRADEITASRNRRPDGSRG